MKRFTTASLPQCRKPVIITVKIMIMIVITGVSSMSQFSGCPPLIKPWVIYESINKQMTVITPLESLDLGQRRVYEGRRIGGTGRKIVRGSQPPDLPMTSTFSLSTSIYPFRSLSLLILPPRSFSLSLLHHFHRLPPAPETVHHPRMDGKGAGNGGELRAQEFIIIDVWEGDGVNGSCWPCVAR